MNCCSDFSSNCGKNRSSFPQKEVHISRITKKFVSARFRRTQPVDLRFFGREQRDHIRRVLKRRTTVAQSASHESRGCIERGGINYPGIPVAANVAININREKTILKISLVLTRFSILGLEVFHTKMVLIRKIRFS